MVGILHRHPINLLGRVSYEHCVYSVVTYHGHVLCSSGIVSVDAGPSLTELDIGKTGGDVSPGNQNISAYTSAHFTHSRA